MRDKQRTNKQTLKIELLSQWKLEAEFRNYSFKEFIHSKKIKNDSFKESIHSKKSKIIHSKKIFIQVKNVLSPRATAGCGRKLIPINAPEPYE